MCQKKLYLKDIEGGATPIPDTTWNEARFWVQHLSVGGGGWRMPTMNELKTALMMLSMLICL